MKVLNSRSFTRTGGQWRTEGRDIIGLTANFGEFRCFTYNEETENITFIDTPENIYIQVTKVTGSITNVVVTWKRDIELTCSVALVQGVDDTLIAVTPVVLSYQTLSLYKTYYIERE